MDALFSPHSLSVIGYVPRKELLWLAAVFSGIVMCCAVYKITDLISLLCFNGYRKLSNMDKVEWKNRGFSTFHAIIASSASLYLLLFSDLFKEGSHNQLVINRTSTVSETILGVSIGYFLSDLAMIVWHFPALGAWEYVARILLFIFFFTHMLFHFDQVKEIFDLGFYSLLLVPPVLAIMNLFWFWKIAKGLVKTLSKKRHRQ
ncbi:hypothetical protein BT93_H1606 [Corymbia citriodora subsp. variegata]|nr:hypothetical protein BT93_H1606 [Corymbia citriodora subsp. variegata]KAF8016137.1 hypothetical protein BT93_H1606 [Corymbia citriodora subsp. variegata]